MGVPSAAGRTVLFLQGPASPFLWRVAQRLQAQGASVRKICFHLGDRLFWFGPADTFRGRFATWPTYVARYLHAHAVTDLVLLGDCRPYHAPAIEAAFAAGVAVHVVEQGYLRPDWLTIEPDGMTSFSRFPRDWAGIEAILAQAGEVPAAPGWRDTFLRYAVQDVIYNLPSALLGWVVHPFYRRYASVPTWQEYGGWLFKLLTGPWRRRRAARTLASVARATGRPGLASERGPVPDAGRSPVPVFLFPLQLPTDYQIRVHAPGGDHFLLVEQALDSFARHAPRAAHLLFKVHPIDNGLNRWQARIAAMARARGVGERVWVVDGGSLDDLLAQAAGVVTINSTVGLTALQAGVPVAVLGQAVYALPGLVHGASLDTFWEAPLVPPPAQVQRLVRALIASVQVRGSFVAPAGIAAGAQAVAARIVEGYPVLSTLPRPPRDRHPDGAAGRS